MTDDVSGRRMLLEKISDADLLCGMIGFTARLARTLFAAAVALRTA